MAAAVLIFVACAAAADPRPVVLIDSYLVAPSSVDELWDTSSAVVRVDVESRAAEAFPSGARYPLVYTRYSGRVVRVLKGDVVAGTAIHFSSMGGRLETADYVLDDTSHARFLEAGHSYIVFLKPLKQIGGLVVDFNHFGAFEVEHSRVKPLQETEATRQWSGVTEAQFVDALDRLARRHARSAR